MAIYAGLNLNQTGQSKRFHLSQNANQNHAICLPVFHIQFAFITLYLRKHASYLLLKKMLFMLDLKSVKINFMITKDGNIVTVVIKK